MIRKIRAALFVAATLLSVGSLGSFVAGEWLPRHERWMNMGGVLLCFGVFTGVIAAMTWLADV